MKVMRSTKEGSLCADCGAPVKVGDPIAYYGPGRVYGLTCHESDRAKEHLARLLASEGGTPPSPKLGVSSSPAAQEWCVRLGFDSTNDVQRSLLALRYADKRGDWIVLRAPRSVGLVVTKSWAETTAAVHGGDAVPYWVEED